MAVAAYLLGAIPFALIYGRWLGKVDITKYGSGNVGGTNVLRILGLGPAAITIISDLAKAVAAVILARALFTDNLQFYIGFPPTTDYIKIGAEVLAGFMAMVGHNWSAYIGFRGGKGVAVYMGGWIIMFPLILAIGALIILPTVIINRRMSRASILGALGILISLIILTIYFDVAPIYLIYSVVAAAIIVFQHRANIVRLQTGTELKLDNKIFKKRHPQPEILDAKVEQ